MTTLHVTEYSEISVMNGKVSQIAQEPAVADSTVTFTSSSVQSSAFNAKTRVVRLYATGACHVEFGSNPTATTGKQKIAADTVEWRGVNPGDKVAAIDA